MDQKPEQYSVEANSKLDSARTAVRTIEQKIVSMENPTDDKAVRMGFLFAVYRAEMWIYYQDHQTQLYEEEESKDIIGAQEDITTFRNLRSSVEVAIRDAQLGEYGHLKRFLRETGEFFKPPGVSIILGLSGKLLELSEIIPEKGPKQKFPLPSWQDPDFNSSHDSTDN